MKSLSASRCMPCVLDQKCLANNVVYFSFLVPLHHQVVYNLAIGCATGQSCFVALERRCKCLVWASIPFDTILASYCLFEVVIDHSQGGTFVGCQNVLDQLFRAIRFSSQLNLNRMPYIQERITDRQRKVGFISTLKQLFRVSSFTRLASADIERVRHLDTDKLWAAILINSDGLPRWAERIFNVQNVRHRCLRLQIISTELVVAKTADLTYAKRALVNLVNMDNSQSEPGSGQWGNTDFGEHTEGSGSKIRITVEQTEDSTRYATKPSTQSSTYSPERSDAPRSSNTTTTSGEVERQEETILFTKVLEIDSAYAAEGPSDEVLYETPRTGIEQKTQLEGPRLEIEKSSLHCEVIRLDMQSKITTLDSEMWYNPARANTRKELNRDKSEDGPEGIEVRLDPSNFYDEGSFEKQFSWNKKYSSIRNVHSDNKFKEIEAVIRKSPQTMMDIVADMHQCGWPTGNRVTEPREPTQQTPHDTHEHKEPQSGKMNQSKNYSELNQSDPVKKRQMFPRVKPQPRMGSSSPTKERAQKESKSLRTKDYIPTGSVKKKQQSRGTTPEANRAESPRVPGKRPNEPPVITPVQEGNPIFTHAMPLATNGSPSFSGERSLDWFASRPTATDDDSTATNPSSISAICTSTSTTERLLTPELVSRLQDVDSRSKTWTPVPLSLQDLISNMHNQQQDYDERRLQSQILDWEYRLARAMETCMIKEIF